MVSTGPVRARLTLAALVVLATAALVGAARVRAPIGWSDLDRWIVRSSPETVTLALARLALLGCAGWLLAGTVLAVAAGCVGARPGGRALGSVAARVDRCSAGHRPAGVLLLCSESSSSMRSIIWTMAPMWCSRVTWRWTSFSTIGGRIASRV